MSNLLEETKEILKDNNKAIEDIKWVGTHKHYVNVDRFLELANVEYDDGFGAQKVADNLLIVGDNWWLERHEYDGSEWWEFKSIPEQPKNKLEVKTLITENVGWESLEEMNGEENENN